MTNYQKREANYQAGFNSLNIRRTLLGIKKSSQAYKDIMSGYNAAKRERIAAFDQRITDETATENER